MASEQTGVQKNGVAYAELSAEEKSELIREILPQCQPQEGSPPNTFTTAQLNDLLERLPGLQVEPRNGGAPNGNNNNNDAKASHTVSHKHHLDITDSAFFQPEQKLESPPSSEAKADTRAGTSVIGQSDDRRALRERHFDTQAVSNPNDDSLDWHGAPRFHKDAHLARAFREKVRSGQFTGPTNGVCPGFMQCNLVVLPEGKHAFDFLLFCQRNPKACPLVEVCDVGSPHPKGLAAGSDLRADVPKYAIYRNGKLEKEVHDATEDWPENSVAFLIGCSFSYDGALMDADIPLRSAEQGKNVPMYDTGLKCRPSGSLGGNMVVSMKPIPALKVSKHIEITSKYKHAHGGPVSVGSAEAIGVKDISRPEWGDAVDIRPDEVPIFHACGVTPQNILMQSKVPFAITHSAGHMFVTDLPSDMGVTTAKPVLRN